MNQNLVKVNKKKLEVLIDLRYSTSKNFTKEKVLLRHLSNYEDIYNNVV